MKASRRNLARPARTEKPEQSKYASKGGPYRYDERDPKTGKPKW